VTKTWDVFGIKANNARATLGRIAATHGDAAHKSAVCALSAIVAGQRDLSDRPASSLLMSGSFVHKIIIAGCTCFASRLPSGPHKRDTMTNDDDRTSPSAGGPTRQYLFVGALIAFVFVAVVLLVIARDSDDAATPSSNAAPWETTAPTATTASDSRGEVVARLNEILQIREQAFRQRDASLFDGVYTNDCSCLRAGRNAIAALKKEKVRWQDRSISLEVQSARNLNNRLWEIVALFISDAFRIETEDGRLVREAPAERIRYRFLLVRTSNTESWRLGSASLVEG
jgi:hypothetical protein